MHQRGRKSASNVAVFPLQTAQHCVQPPPDATRIERRLFIDLVLSCHAEPFRRSDAPLILSYVQSTLAVRTFAKAKNAVKQWAHACRVQAMLARTLRLTPHSRMTASQTRKTAAHNPSAYELMDLEDDA